MSDFSVLKSRVWMLPWVLMLALYAAKGWLDPAYWLGTGLPPQTLQAHPLPKTTAAPRAAQARAKAQGAQPWPDESALRRLLAWHGLSPLGLTLGPQRGRSSEVRLLLRWQGRMGHGLAMLESLALDWPQMVPEALTLQADVPGQWRFEWRGVWQQLEAPNILPVRPPAQAELQALGSARVFDPGWLLGHQRRLYAGGAEDRQWLRLARPEQLQLLAVAHDPAPQAWVGWQQHVLLLRVGDRIGPEQARVSRIGPTEVVLMQSGQTHHLRPLTTPGWPVEAAP